MKTFVNPSKSSADLDDPEGATWIKCIRTAQVFLICLSFTVIHHITNPFALSENSLTASTAVASAAESALLVLLCARFCISSRQKEETKTVKKYSLDSAHPSDFSVHPVYFI